MAYVNQVLLKAPSPKGEYFKMTWLPDCETLKPGMQINLKGNPINWIVSQIYCHRIERENVNRNWHVGGL
mgnify:CR=1 FL=1